MALQQQQQQQQPQRRQQRTMAFFLLPCLLVLIFSPLEVAGVTSSIFSCSAETEACFADEDCFACLLGWPVGDSLATCAEYSTEDANLTCAETGAENCCGFAPGTAESCMANEYLEAYWVCHLELDGCVLEDMPCSTAGMAAAIAEDESESENAGSIRGPPFWACRYGAGAVAAAMIAVVAAGL